MEKEILDVISKLVTNDTAKQYADFCDWNRNDTEYNHYVSSQVFANLNFKKQLAKNIVTSVLNGNDYNYLGYQLMSNSIDVRLRSLIKYYLSVEILGNPDLSEEIIRKAISNFSRTS